MASHETKLSKRPRRLILSSETLRRLDSITATTADPVGLTAPSAACAPATNVGPNCTKEPQPDGGTPTLIGVNCPLPEPPPDEPAPRRD